MSTILAKTKCGGWLVQLEKKRVSTFLQDSGVNCHGSSES